MPEMPNVNHPGLLKRVVAHCAFSAWVCFSLLMSVGLTSPSFAEDFAKGELEFRGRVILPPRTLGRRQFVQVTLVEVGSPFTARTYADAGGNFRFRKLNPASYTLSFYIPAFGEISQTLHLTESNVTAKNRFEKRFEVGQEALNNARELGRGQVSVRQLTIEYSARREYDKAVDRLEDRDVDDAISHLQRALEISPQYMEAINNLGTIYFQLKDYSRAEEYFRRALVLEPNAFEPLLNLGGVLLALKQTDEILDLNLRAYELRPQDPLANAQLGLSYYFLEDYEQALQYISRTKEIDPIHFTKPQLSLAEIHLRRGEYGLALRELREFLDRFPDSSEADDARGTVDKILSSLEASAKDRLPL
ncbi:MAG: hypothetical protein A3F68_02275 [Acidobacteria bacterium RIFCSPLOWO2_12_FULL_54_10]|nr:MAG: hypothetical protein A3F68_02275 [Acidobacteria bacterium RIFCSPLOWO2_12_FULL_54_10]